MRHEQSTANTKYIYNILFSDEQNLSSDCFPSELSYFFSRGRENNENEVPCLQLQPFETAAVLRLVAQLVQVVQRCCQA